MNRNLIHILKIAAFVGAVFALHPSAVAQNGFNMPFSQYGIGQSGQPYNLPIVSRLGGTAYTLAGNNYVNPFNPASYGAIERESFVFDMGVGVQLTTLRDNNNTLRDADGNVAYLMAAMPVTKWWKLAGGLMPYSTVSYEIVTSKPGPASDTVRTIYSGGDGEGNPSGVNEIFLGSAFNVLNGGNNESNLQVGFNLYYLTGTIHRTISQSFPNSGAGYMSTRRYKRTTLNNLFFDLGVQLRQPLGENAVLTIGVVYKPYLDLKIKDMALIYTYHSNDETETLVDTIIPVRGQSADFRSDLEQAQTIGVGISLEFDKKWCVAFDGTFASWQGMKYSEGQTLSIIDDSELRYNPYSNFAASIERRGSMDASTYWGRMSWSLGAHLTQGAFSLNIEGADHILNEWGFGGGITMPMRKGRSLLTLSVGYNSLGSRDLLQSNTLTFGIAVSSCERWFFKRKFN